MIRLPLRKSFSLLALAAAMLAGSAITTAQNTSITLGDDPQIAAAGVEIGVFASGLNFPMGLIELPDHSLLVATSDPTGGSFFQSTGELLRLTDANDDGVADDAGTTLATGLAGPLVAIQRAGDLIFVTSARTDQEGIYVLRRGEHWRSEMTLLGKIDVLSPGSEHQTYGLAIRKHGNRKHAYDLVFNAGAYGNVDGGDHQVSVSGLAEGNLVDASIYLITVTESNEEITFSAPVKVAGQLRNASTFIFERKSGDLIIGENGMDTPGNEIVSFSADEIDIVAAGDVGIVVSEFGFPDTYIDYATGEHIGSSGVQPVLAFNAVDGSESEGIASLVQMPESFPAPFGDGYVAGFHGQFDSVGDQNEENPLVFFNLQTGERFELIANDNPEIGHLDSLVATGTSLFVADLCGTGSLIQMEPCGVIYRLVAGE